MVAEARAAFEKRFGRPAEFGVRAPGRVNLIGEHTDYNEGLVLPAAIDRDTVALAARRADARFRVYSRDLDAEAEFDARAPARAGSWHDYVQGVVFACAERGIEVGGLDLLLASRVPREAGLSSSAALGVAVATAIDRAQGLGLDARARAWLAHRGESEFVGVGCGLMDHFASALGRRDALLRLDCRSLETREIPLPGASVTILVAHSGVRRALAEHGYRDRVDECRGALEAARAAGVAPPGATALRDLAPDLLPELEGRLEGVLFRRARHVIRENERVDGMCAALEAEDFEAAGALLREGMRSLREDFEVSTAELDALCEIADAQPGVFGSRLTGAGFGGCTLHLVSREAAPAVEHALAAEFERRFGRRPPVWAVTPSEGAGDLPL